MCLFVKSWSALQARLEKMRIGSAIPFDLASLVAKGLRVNLMLLSGSDTSHLRYGISSMVVVSEGMLFERQRDAWKGRPRIAE